MTDVAHLLPQAALVAFVALGAWVAMGPDMILHRVGRLVEMLPHWMAKPIATCPRCMCSFWGIVTLLATGCGIGISFNYDLHVFAVQWWRVGEVVVLIFAAAGIQELLQRS